MIMTTVARADRVGGGASQKGAGQGRERGMSLHTDTLVERVKADPNFKELVAKRKVFAWVLTIAMLLIYFGFIFTIAFNKAFLAQPLVAGGVTTIGMPLGVLVIVSAFLLTGIYVRRANGEFDDITKKIVEGAKK
jgi:uncharacterized membrane protein (DUF485 family)